jgi:hypothetical protein
MCLGLGQAPKSNIPGSAAGLVSGTVATSEPLVR